MKFLTGLVTISTAFSVVIVAVWLISGRPTVLWYDCVLIGWPWLIVTVYVINEVRRPGEL